MKSFTHLLSTLFLLLGVLSASAQQDTILIDFGNQLSPAPWNNLADPAAGRIDNLLNTAGTLTGKSIVVYDPFNNINTNGATAPDPALGFPPTATSDSFFGNIAPFGGQSQPTGGVELTGLKPESEHVFTVFASRMAVSDNREARYTFQGLSVEVADLDASNNSDQTVTVALFPDSSGVIRIEAAPGPNNDNSTGFFYLGAISMAYEKEEPPVVVVTIDTLLIDFGNILSPAPWNNLTDPAAGLIEDLLSFTGELSGISLAVYDSFNNINTAGTTMPDPSIGFPPTATGDSFFGNTATFGGQIQPTGGVELSNLDPAKPYGFILFASRAASPDNREARYTFQGQSIATADLNASNNNDMVATATLFPDSAGIIRIEAAPGPNNDNSSGFFYLGAMKVFFDRNPPPPSTPMDTLLVDFGNQLSPAPWNNISNPVAGQIEDLLTSKGFASGKSIEVYDPFNNINTAGTITPDPAIGFPATATGDSFFGNTATFGGQVQPTGGVVFAKLNPDKPHTFVIFASRTASPDNRETRYILQGLTQDTVFLNASNNTNMVATATLFPDEEGMVWIEAAPGPNNNNGSGFFYLGAMKVIYESEEAGAAELALVAPNGGEYWQAGKTPAIIWASKNLGQVILEYSTDEGSSWTAIDTVPAFQREYPWTVPNTPSNNCLVRISADTLNSQSASVFEIADDDVTCRIVVLGSSTAEGTGATPAADSSWVNRYRKDIFQRNTRYEVTNLARGGYTTYHVLPTGTSIPPGVNVSIDPQRNITRALSLDPYAIIINMPSNDAANNFGVSAQLGNIALIAATAQDEGAGVWVGTPQPRNFSPSQIMIQTALRDSILAIYGERAIDFWSGLAAPNGFIDGAFDAGDGIHLNNAGHRLLYERVLAKALDTIDCTLITSTRELPREVLAKLKAYPNPFREGFTLEFETTSAGWLELRLTDAMGRHIEWIRQPVGSAGLHTLEIRPNLPHSFGPQMLFGLVAIQDDRGLAQGNLRLMQARE
jgi:lysophospholipase L1-like esterase